jgi:hypothetical protein
MSQQKAAREPLQPTFAVSPNGDDNCLPLGITPEILDSGRKPLPE